MLLVLIKSVASSLRIDTQRVIVCFIKGTVSRFLDLRCSSPKVTIWLPDKPPKIFSNLVSTSANYLILNYEVLLHYIVGISKIVESFHKRFS